MVHMIFGLSGAFLCTLIALATDADFGAVLLGYWKGGIAGVACSALLLAFANARHDFVLMT